MNVIDLNCSVCSKDFTVMVDPKSDVLCPGCHAEAQTLEELYRPRDWEKRPGVDYALFKGMGIGLICMAIVLAIFVWK